MNTFAFQHELDRLLASINTLLIWVLAFLYFQVFLNSQSNIEKIQKIVLFNIVILLFFYIVMLIAHYILGMSNLSYMGKVLFSSSWYEDAEEVRFQGFLEYPNLVPLFLMMFTPFLFSYVNTKKLGKLKMFCLIVFSILLVNASLSRSGLIAILFGFVVYIIITYASKNIKLFIAISSFTSAIILCLMYFFQGFTFLYDTFTQVVNAREGSNLTRGSIYQSSVGRAFENSPLIGMGIKDISPYDNLPYGSHSTYLGFFYKTGIIGFVIGILLFLFINFKIYAQSKHYFKNYNLKFFLCMLGSLSLVLIFEDIDGSNWLIVYYFSVVGILLNKKNWRNSNENLFSNV